MHRAESILVDRKTSGTIAVRRPHVSITGTVTPAALGVALIPLYRENGLAARLLMAYPPRRVRRWTEADVSEELVREVDRVFGRLFGLDLGVDPDGFPEPVEMHLNEEAKELFIEFYEEHAKALAAAEDEETAAKLAKLEEVPLRLSIALHLWRWAEGEPVDPNVVDAETMRCAIELTRWLRREALRIMRIIGESPEWRLAELIEWIRRRGGEVTPRDVYRAGPRRLRGKIEEAERALNELAEAGFGAWWEQRPGVNGGRPSRTFRLLGTPPESEDGASFENGCGDKTSRFRLNKEVLSPEGIASREEVGPIAPRGEGSGAPGPAGREITRCGNVSIEKENGNVSSRALETAPDAGSQGGPNVPGASNQAGTLGQALKAASGAAFSEGESYCSQNSLSSPPPEEEIWQEMRKLFWEDDL
jgi:hypothetical protein